MENTVTVLLEAPNITKPEFRLYYDETGALITYSCEKLEGKYIIIDALTFAQARPDVRVIDNKLVHLSLVGAVLKIVPDKNKGTLCAAEDVSIVVDKSYVGNINRWILKTYEL